MRCKRWLLLAMLAGAPALAGCAGTEPAAEAQNVDVEATTETGAIEGLVLTDEFQPIGRADVTVLETQVTVKSLDDGRYGVDGLEPGDYNLLVRRIGYFERTLPVMVEAGTVTDFDIELQRIPVSEPAFEWTTIFYGNLTAGTAAGGPEPVAEPLDTADFVVTIPSAKEDGTPIAAVDARIELAAADTPGAVDLDMYLLDASMRTLDSSTSGGPNEIIEYPKLMRAGDYTVRVYFWAGAAAEFTVTVTILYEQGELATFILKEG